MRNEINLTDEQIEEIFEAGCGTSLGVDDLVFTRESIDDFLEGRKSYNERGAITDHDHELLVVVNVQARKGQPRGDLMVRNFGSVRAVYHGFGDKTDGTR